MRFRKVVAAFVAVLALSACNQRRETLTESYGHALLSGEVSLVGMPGASPAGVVVSVRGTGMAVTLSEDGRFDFAGVPANALLDFQRTADGIEASLAVDSRSGFVSVALAQKSASPAPASSKRRSGGRTSVFEFEGLLKAVAADSIVVADRKGADVTVALTAETVIRKGRAVRTPADLVIGTRVHVKATRADEVYTAVQVIVQNENDGEEGVRIRAFEGVVRSASATQLEVTLRSGDILFELTPETIIRAHGNAPVLPAGILPGTRVKVKARLNPDGTNVALRVQVMMNGPGGSPPVRKELEGLVVSSSLDQLVLQTQHSEETIALTSATVIRKGNVVMTGADLQPGWRVHVRVRTGEDGTQTAELVIVQNTGEDDGEDDGEDEGEDSVSGLVASVGTSSLVVTSPRGDVTVNVTAATVIKKRGQPVTLESIVPGTRVNAEGTSTAPGTLDATRINVH